MNVEGSEVTSFLQRFFDVESGGVAFHVVAIPLAVLVTCLVVMRILLRLLDRVTVGLDIEISMRHFIRSFAKAFLWIVTLTLIAGQMGIPSTSLIAVLSVAGLAISLAVQGTLTNLAGGLMLLSNKPFKSGDYVEAGANSGSVLDIGLVYTKLKTPDNKIVSVPNSDISSARIINYSAQETRRVEWTFTAVYEADGTLVKETIAQVVGAHPKTMFTPPPQIRTSAFKDNHVEYIVRVWCATVDYWDLYYDLNDQVKAAFDEKGIRMNYPFLSVQITDRERGKDQENGAALQ